MKLTEQITLSWLLFKAERLARIAEDPDPVRISHDPHDKKEGKP